MAKKLKFTTIKTHGSRFTGNLIIWQITAHGCLAMTFHKKRKQPFHVSRQINVAAHKNTPYGPLESVSLTPLDSFNRRNLRLKIVDNKIVICAEKCYISENMNLVSNSRHL